jgi:NRAMP (natural resistance-associated macrophage protein)-like metal ion transporter
MGPGLVTGASDDDPSGIATYSQAGARFGYQLLWTAIVTLPLMIAIQEMCARIGLVTNKGLMSTIKKHYPRWITYCILLTSIPSITLNIGANIAGMGAVGQMLFPAIPAPIFSLLFTVILIYTLINWNYRRISTVLKWLCITLFSYLLIPFLQKTDWMQVFRNTFIPAFKWDKEYLIALVGILGTTISPYLFFWQASMEAEEENDRQLVVDKTIIEDMETDVKGGMLLTNVVFYFILLATGTVLYQAGIHEIDTVADAARALKPLAGKWSYLLFALGVLGTGFLAIPVLAGSLSYMLAECFSWEEGMSKKFHEARGFYYTLIISLVIGFSIYFTGISPMKALLYTAVLYGLVSPILIAVILHISNNPLIMGEYTNRRRTNVLGALTLLLMTASAGALLYFLFS